MSKKWACRVYYNVNPFVGLSFHETPVPPLMVPAPLPHIQVDVVQGLWLGSFLSNGKERKIVSDHLLMVGRMSDAGMVVPHVSIPPSPWNILTTLFGMSNAVWGSSSTQIACKNLLWGNQDCDTACTPFGHVPLSLNLGCSDPFCIPSDIVVLWGTVYVGMSWADIGACLIDVAIFVATDVFMKVAGHYAGPMKDALKGAVGKLFKKGVSDAAEDVEKKFVVEADQKLGDEFLETAEKKTALQEAADKVSEVAGAAAEKLKSAGRAIKDAASSAAEAAGEKMKAVGDAISPFTDALAEKFRPISDALTGDANKAYASKAAKLMGMADKLSVSEDELAKIAEEEGSKSASMVKNLKENLASFLEEHASKVKGLNDAIALGEKEIVRDDAYLKNMDAEALTEAMHTQALKDSIKELDDATSRVVAQNTAWVLMKKSASLVSKIVYSGLIRRGNLLGDGTQGGLFSVHGFGWTSYFHSSMEEQDRGLKREHEAEDYWYGTKSTATTGWKDTSSGATDTWDYVYGAATG